MPWHMVALRDAASEADFDLRVPAAGVQDVMMPEVDGLAVLRWVRSSERHRALPVVSARPYSYVVQQGHPWTNCML